MRASHLRLDRYWVEEFSFAADDKYNFDPEADSILSAEDLEVEVSPLCNPEDHLEWCFDLVVRLRDKGGKFPYRFSIKLTGFFFVHKDYPGDAAQLARVNSPSILYASAREILAMATGRSRYEPMVLPSITFFEPSKPPAKATEEPTSKAEVPAKKPVRRRAARQRSTRNAA